MCVWGCSCSASAAASRRALEGHSKATRPSSALEGRGACFHFHLHLHFHFQATTSIHFLMTTTMQHDSSVSESHGDILNEKVWTRSSLTLRKLPLIAALYEVRLAGLTKVREINRLTLSATQDAMPMLQYQNRNAASCRLTANEHVSHWP